MTASINIAILASGKGSNADRICAHFKQHDTIRVQLIVANKANAGVLRVAESHGVAATVIPNERLTEDLLSELEKNSIDFAVLAGFLRMIPENVVKRYRNKMLNIHPALLPQFGGKGMYGSRVHEAVIASQAKESGITIHYVNEHYDEGDIVFQARCQIDANDTPENLADKVHTLEHRHFPEVIEKVIRKQFNA